MYKKTKDNDCIIRKSDGACIPIDTDNSDYREYLTWRTEGNTPDEPDAEPVLTYSAKRESEYPKIGDQLDVLWKQLLQDRTDGNPLITEAENMLDGIVAIKTKYPKK